MQDALTDQGYWDAVWTFADDHADAAVPRVHGGFMERWLMRAFAPHLGPGRRFLEVGAGGSAWPAYVAARFGAEAWGIDFSRQGLDLSARAVVAGTAPVHLIDGDLFDRDKLPLASFDVVYSGGFVEHFPTPRPLMERLAELVTPGGVVVTAVPNLCGLNGLMQRALDMETWRRHVVLSPAALDAAHATGGLMPLEPARFLGLADVGAVNWSRLAERLPPPAMRGVSFGLAKLRAAANWLEARTGRDGGRFLSPSVGGIYRRSNDDA
jgi:SAM-dependent methyltransferase